MLIIKDKKECCGCTACANICPVKCISMVEDVEGFLYPKAEKDRCINCGLCENVCPIVNKVNSQVYNRAAYVVRNKEESILQDSTSGGFFTPLAKWIIKNKGVVCAASFDDSFYVTHQFIDSKDVEPNNIVLEKFRGSKYVQSQMGDIYTKIKSYLEKNILVCYVGTTCQVYGLKSFLGKEYDNLYTIDLVCHGTPSPKLWRKYLDFQRKQYGQEITKISFRSKKYGYHNAVMSIKFANGQEYNASARVDYMLKCFFSEIASRPSCYTCPFKVIDRCSDITLYDCWHVSELIEGKTDDNKGYTNIIIQSTKGEKLLETLEDSLEIYETDLKKAVELDGIMILKSAEVHPERKQFYIDLDKHTMKEHMQLYCPIKKTDRLYEGIKIFLYKLGLLRIVKKYIK